MSTTATPQTDVDTAALGGIPRGAPSDPAACHPGADAVPVPFTEAPAVPGGDPDLAPVVGAATGDDDASPAVGAGPAAEPAPEPLGRRFGALLTVTGLANLGDGIVQLGAPLVALTLTRSPVQIALLTAAAWLPWLLMGLLAGVVVDRRDRRNVQTVALAARAALLAGGAALVASGRLTMTALVLLVLAYGVTEVFADLAQTSLVPDIVPRSRLQAANGRTLAVQQVANTFVGAPIAGLVLALGAGWVFGLPAAMAVVAVVVLLRGIPGRYRHASTERRSAGSEVAEGLSFVWDSQVLKPLIISGALVNMVNTAYFAVFVLWAVGDGSRLGLEPAHYPLLLAVLAVGAVIGSLFTERLVRSFPELRVMLGSWGVCAALLIVPVLVPTIAGTAVTLFLLGLFVTVGNTVSQSMRQRIVPAGLLGRVSGASRTLVFGLMPVGAMLGGLVADRFGLETVFVMVAVLSLLATVYPAVRIRTAMVRTAEEHATALQAAAEADASDADTDTSRPSAAPAEPAGT